MLRVLFFAQLADRLDKTHEDIALPPEIQDVRGLLALLRTWRRLARGAGRKKGAGSD